MLKRTLCNRIKSEGAMCIGIVCFVAHFCLIHLDMVHFSRNTANCWWWQLLRPIALTYCPLPALISLFAAECKLRGWNGIRAGVAGFGAGNADFKQLTSHSRYEFFFSRLSWNSPDAADVSNDGNQNDVATFSSFLGFSEEPPIKIWRQIHFPVFDPYL